MDNRARETEDFPVKNCAVQIFRSACLTRDSFPFIFGRMQSEKLRMFLTCMLPTSHSVYVPCRTKKNHTHKKSFCFPSVVVHLFSLWQAIESFAGSLVVFQCGNETTKWNVRVNLVFQGFVTLWNIPRIATYHRKCKFVHVFFLFPCFLGIYYIFAATRCRTKGKPIHKNDVLFCNACVLHFVCCVLLDV